MMTFNTQITLLDTLEGIVENLHLNDVKCIIQSLLKINKIKYSLEKHLNEDSFYEKIALEFIKEFGIKAVQIIYTTDNVQNILYSNQNRLNNSCVYSSIVAQNSKIDIVIDAQDFSQDEQIIFNTYCKELVHLVYMQFILTSFEKSIEVDYLTKLQNRVSFNSEMKNLIPLALREKMNFGVILFNIDRFRAVNDEHGDQFGDQFLKLYADTIKKNIRESDIAVRFGGGEFLVLLTNVSSEDKTIEIAQKIQEKLASVYLISPNNDKFRKTVSVGISMFPDDSTDINEVIKYSEMALSDAKDSGRNKLVRYKENELGEIELF